MSKIIPCKHTLYLYINICMHIYYFQAQGKAMKFHVFLFIVPITTWPTTYKVFFFTFERKDIIR